MGSSAEHTRLVNQLLEALALAGILAWPNNTGAIKYEGRFLRYGKKGSGDIIAVLPPSGRHAEIEAKTGNATQRKEQKTHQRIVEKMGGLYIVARSPEDMLEQLARNGHPQNGTSVSTHASQPSA